MLRQSHPHWFDRNDDDDDGGGGVKSCVVVIVEIHWTMMKRPYILNC